MKVYTYSEARQKLSKLLEDARNEKVIIKKRSGEVYSITYKKPTVSPFDIKGIKTKPKTKDILGAVEESRSKAGKQRFDRHKSLKGTSICLFHALIAAIHPDLAGTLRL